jgi:hypothetical protein
MDRRQQSSRSPAVRTQGHVDREHPRQQLPPTNTAANADACLARAGSVACATQAPLAGIELTDDIKFTKSCGVALAADGTFSFPDIGDGACELQVRDSAAVLVQRPITVRGGFELGDWAIDG